MQDSLSAQSAYADALDAKKTNNFKKTQIALSGSLVALSSGVIGYQMFGFIGGLSFVVLVFGIMWFFQIQLETALDTIEIQVKHE